jgi:hypothetical protein
MKGKKCEQKHQMLPNAQEKQSSQNQFIQVSKQVNKLPSKE